MERFPDFSGTKLSSDPRNWGNLAEAQAQVFAYANDADPQLHLEGSYGSPDSFPRDDEGNRMLHVCPDGCGAENMQAPDWDTPVEIDEHGAMLMTLECAGCDTRVLGAFTPDELSAFDLHNQQASTDL